MRKGELPERLTRIRSHLVAVRTGLIQDIAGEEIELTTAQGVLVDRAVGLLGVIRTVEESLSEQGIMKDGILAAVLQDNYLAYCNSLRLILRELGIDKRAGDKVLSPLEVAAEIDAENAGREAERAAREAAGQGRETVAAQSPGDTKEDAGSPGGGPGSEIEGKDPGVAGEIVDPEATQAEIQHRGDEDNEKSDS